MSARARLFLILWLAGLAGVLSFQLVDLPRLIAKLPGAANKPLPLPMAVIRLLSVMQPGVLVGVAAIIGVMLAPKVGLTAPAAQAVADRRPVLPALRPQLLPGLLGAAVAAPAIIGCWLLWKHFLTPSFMETAAEFSRMLPPATRLLYGGFTEEVLLRWGFMTLVVWSGWKGLQGGTGAPRSTVVVGAIVCSALVFGAGHLPLAIALNGGPSLALVGYVVFANSIFGVVAGVLYWKYGLESAMVAHALTHVGFLLSGPI
jgi:hypothetical protein